MMSHLTAMLGYGDTALRPLSNTTKTRKTKTPKPAAEKHSSKLLIVRYSTRKPMFAVQTVTQA
jgi:hypothetical protein